MPNFTTWPIFIQGKNNWKRSSAGCRVGLVAVKSEEPAHLTRISGRPPVA